jgi:hypothetical protein
MTNTAMLLQALNLVVTTLGLEQYAHPRVRKAIAAGCNPALLILRVSSYDISFIQDLRLAFGLSTSVQLRVETGDPKRTAVSMEVTWASGGGSAGVALAELSHHMEIVQKAAQAEMILNEVVRGLHGRGKDNKDLVAAMTEVGKMVEAEMEKARALTASTEPTPSEG